MNDARPAENINLLEKLQTPKVFYTIISIIVFLIITILILFNDGKIFSQMGRIKSNEEVVKDVFIILFFALLTVVLAIAFLPNIKELKDLFLQIHSITYVIFYTIFFILFYTITSTDTLNQYYYIINPLMLVLGVFAFYKATQENWVDKMNINYERIKMILLAFCFITIMITFYNINPGNAADKYFGYSMLLTIIIAVFGLLYAMVLISMNTNSQNKTNSNLFDNFSSFGVYGSILFAIFLIIVTTVISVNKDSFFANKAKSSSIIILLLFISILWILLLGSNLFGKQAPGENTFDLKNVKLYQKTLLILFGLVISGLAIYWLSYNIEELLGNSTPTSFILNILLVILVISFIYRIINVRAPIGNKNKNAFFSLLSNSILYIPCLTNDLFDKTGQFFGEQYKETELGSIIMLLVIVSVIILYVNIPNLFNLVNTQGGKQLVNRPVYTDTIYSLGTYEQLNGSDKLDYQYAISFWVFIDAMPPNTNPNYNKFTSLLNFGNKPNVLYKAKTNTLMITTEQKNLKEITKNKLVDFDKNGNRIIYKQRNIPLQKWNNIIINYNGGTLDIFLNGELVKSSPETIPYFTYENLTIGENDGIKGGICNVVYFRKHLTSPNIYYIYNTVKNRTPPVLNDSADTIIINDNP